MRWIWLAFVVMACGTASEAQDYKKIGDEELKELMNKEVQVVDIRTPRETDRGIIKGSKVIDFYSPDFMKQIEELDKEKPVVLYCAVGGRSAKASRQLLKAGFSQVYDLKDGIRGWVTSGNSLAKE
jgi:rhodanese-related sulfurtransferase